MSGEFDISGLMKSRRAAREAQLSRSNQIRSRLAEMAPPLFRQYGVETAVLFGSVADGRCHPESDIDMLVIPLPPEDWGPLRRALSEILNRPIDLYTQTDDPQFIRKVFQRGEVIYGI